MRVVDLMSRVLISAPPDMSWQDALCLMREHHVHHLPVLQGGRLLGMLLETDIPRAAMMQGQPALVERVMHRNLPRVTPCALVSDALALMLRQKTSVVAVVEGEDLVGLLTHTDLMKTLGQRVAAYDDALHVRLRGSVPAALAGEVHSMVRSPDGQAEVIFRLSDGAREGRRLLDRLLREPGLDVLDAQIHLPGRRPVPAAASGPS